MHCFCLAAVNCDVTFYSSDCRRFSAKSTTEMWVFALSITPNLWNVFKFLLFEFIISVLIRGSYIELLRTVGSRSYNASRPVSLVVTRLGRLTPYEFVWWQTEDPGRRLIAPKLLLVTLNVLLLSLTLVAEFGSGSVENWKLEDSSCYGRRSELQTRKPLASLEKYLAVKSVLPQVDCMHKNRTGRYLMPIERNGWCTIRFRNDQPEAIRVAGCSTQPGKILNETCSEKYVHDLLGTAAVRNAGWKRVFPRLNITSVEVLHPKIVRPIFTKTSRRVLVHGEVRDAVVVYGNEGILVNTKPRQMHCYMKHYNKNSWDAQFWTPRSCYFVHNGTEVLYAVNHRYEGDMLRAQIALTSAKTVHVKKGDLALVAPREGQLIARPMGTENHMVHRGILLFVAELLGPRRMISTISSNVRLTMEQNIVDDVTVRLYGFMDGLGQYRYKRKQETGNQVATVNLLFVLPIFLLLFLSMIQQLFCMLRRPRETLPCSIEEAVDPENILRFSSGSRCIDRTDRTLTFQRLVHWKFSSSESEDEYETIERHQYLANQQPNSP